MDLTALSTKRRLLRKQLLQLLQQTLGSKLEIVDHTVMNRRHDYIVLLLRLHHPSIEVVVKLAGPEAPVACPFDRTAMLHQLVMAHTSIPMPEVLAVDVSYQTWPWRYFIKTFVPGHEWAVVQQGLNAGELAHAYRQIGDAVAQLHTIQFPLFGEITIDGGVRGDPDYIRALTERARHTIRNARLRELFLSVLDEQADDFTDVREARLCHEDLHRHNILFQYHQGQWRLATILDFDKAWAGHRETDLARLEFWNGMESAAFWEAYEVLCPVPRQYQKRRQVYQLLWCFEYARPTARHLANTRRLCAALGLPHLEGFE